MEFGWTLLVPFWFSAVDRYKLLHQPQLKCRLFLGLLTYFTQMKIRTLCCLCCHLLQTPVVCLRGWKSSCLGLCLLLLGEWLGNCNETAAPHILWGEWMVPFQSLELPLRMGNVKTTDVFIDFSPRRHPTVQAWLLNILDIAHLLSWSLYHDSLDVALVSVYSSYIIPQDHYFPYLLTLA